MVMQRTWRNDNGGIIATAAVAAPMTARAAAAWAGTGAATVTATTATAAASAPTRTWHGDSKGPRAIFDDSHAGPRRPVDEGEPCERLLWGILNRYASATEYRKRWAVVRQAKHTVVSLEQRD
ncbi:hypothetical protein KXW44_002649 [Aspergillus fumigatus]|nr:hypothetical protein KXW82_008403 [Aspergillus fumigatus]KAH3345602.1 hypothetical protein KXW44_002649 [Aspergillus fumigatus]